MTVRHCVRMLRFSVSSQPSTLSIECAINSFWLGILKYCRIGRISSPQIGDMSPIWKKSARLSFYVESGIRPAAEDHRMISH